MPETINVDSLNAMRVNYIPTFDRITRKPLHPAAWRVSIYDGEEWCVIGSPVTSLHFERRKDAEIAMAALVTAELSTVDSLLKAGLKRIKRTMYEALQW